METQTAAVSEKNNIISTFMARRQLRSDIEQLTLNMAHSMDMSERYRLQARRFEAEREVLQQKLAGL